MENEIDRDLCDENKSNSEFAFKLDYSNQTLKGNKQFQDWKIRMLKIYGNNAKLFRCKYDNCYFYQSNKECKTKPYYKANCPICNLSICYYCLRNSDNLYDRGECCIKRRIYCIIFQDGYAFIKPEESDDVNCYYSILAIIFIPIISFMYFIAYFSVVFFYKLSKKNSEGIYENIFNSASSLFTEIGINVGFAFALSIPFIIIDIYFKILLLIISLPLKNYPLKIYCGILYQGIRGSL